jgi:SAM-dependent methyltransferase/uncharacterized protein YbaR (Trm112 family)
MNDLQREKLLSVVYERLRCPACHVHLHYSCSGSELRCPACHTSYPVISSGVPVLLLPEQRTHFDALLKRDPGGRRMAAEYGKYGTWRAKARAFLKPPSIVYDEDTPRRYSWIYDILGDETLVLSIGGGPGRENPRVINLNINAFDSVDIIGDGTNLPLLDESFDLVTANAVIEHISNPVELISEMHRVLKPGGYAQLMIPFVFPFHAYPTDYQRFTAPGIAALTYRFQQVELSVLTGPTSAMLVVFREYLRILCPAGDQRAVRSVLNGVSGWLTFLFKYLDVWLNRKPQAARLAAAFYYLGRKP